MTLAGLPGKYPGQELNLTDITMISGYFQIAMSPLYFALVGGDHAISV